MPEHRFTLHTRFFDHFPDPLCVVGRGLVCGAANSAFVKLFGNGKNPTVGHPLKDFLSSMILEQITPALECCFSRESNSEEVQYILVDATPVALRCWPLSADLPTYVAFSLHPAPSGKDASTIELEKAQQAAAEANYRNAEMRAALRYQSAQNSESQRRKDEFLAMLGHQLRNHLAPVRNAARFLHHKLSETSEVRWCVTVINRQISQLARLIDGLLDMARLESGQFDLNKDRLLLSDIVAKAVEWTQPLLEEQRQTLQMVEPEQPIWVDADLQRIAQALEHLLHNAAYATGPRGQIQVHVRQERAEAVISVQDQGRGIPPDLLSRIFDLYGEIPLDTERPQSEPGLGLAVVRRVIEFHGGSIQASSLGPGQGTRYTIRLPVATPPTAAITGEGVPDLLNENPAASRILVVDDNEDVAISFGALLEVLGHEVRVVLDGPMAIDAVRDFRPHIVFLDIAMPEMDGYEVARRLRAEHRGIRLVAVTGYGQDHDAERAQRVGFDHHLLKPVDLKDLQALLGH
ncbi:hypothetical protein CCP3SC1AL1_560003 [Gammaproteobacteria bacterium]